jgi:hypothetical protein
MFEGIWQALFSFFFRFTTKLPIRLVKMESKNFYHLLIEDLRLNSQPNIPALKSSIKISDGGGLLAFEDNRTPAFVDERYCGKDNVYVFQPIWNNTDSHLLMICPGRKRPLINGLPAPPLALLNVKDDIFFPNAYGYLAHVSIYIQPHIGPVPDNRIGRKCPLCRSVLRENTPSYICYRCGQAIHYSINGGSDSDALNCVNVCDSCPVCRAPICLEDKYVYLPEFMQKPGN